MAIEAKKYWENDPEKVREAAILIVLCRKQALLRGLVDTSFNQSLQSRILTSPAGRAYSAFLMGCNDIPMLFDTYAVIPEVKTQAHDMMPFKRQEILAYISQAKYFHEDKRIPKFASCCKNCYAPLFGKDLVMCGECDPGFKLPFDPSEVHFREED